MAEARDSENLDRFTCLICCNLLNDPVSIFCGHSFCLTCINTQWDRTLCGPYHCPTCKEQFNPRPILGRNVMLAEMVERLKRSRALERTLAGPEDVECDICVGQKHQAVKSCLDCVASFCNVHFKLHDERIPDNRHKVTETRYNLKERICGRHKKLQDVLCCTEQRAVCFECTISHCRGHNTVPFAERRAELQLEIQKIQSEVLSRTGAALNSMTDVKKAIQSIKSSAEATLDQCEKILLELISSAQRKRLEIRGMIKAAEEAEVKRAEEILTRMDQEVMKLKKRDKDLLQLAQLDDDFLFLLHCTSLSDISAFEDITHVTVNQSALKEIQNSVSELEVKVEEFYRTGSRSEAGPVNRNHMVPTSVPTIREDFLQHFRRLMVDPGTAEQ